jgi:hypothetical protein
MVSWANHIRLEAGKALNLVVEVIQNTIVHFDTLRKVGQREIAAGFFLQPGIGI